MGRNNKKAEFDKLFPQVLKKVQSGDRLIKALKDVGMKKHIFYVYVSPKQLLEINQNKVARLHNVSKKHRKHYFEDLQNWNNEDEF